MTPAKRLKLSKSRSTGWHRLEAVSVTGVTLRVNTGILTDCGPEQ